MCSCLCLSATTPPLFHSFPLFSLSPSFLDSSNKFSGSGYTPRYMPTSLRFSVLSLCPLFFIFSASVLSPPLFFPSPLSYKYSYSFSSQHTLSHEHTSTHIHTHTHTHTHSDRQTCAYTLSLQASQVADIFHFCAYKVIIIILGGVAVQESVGRQCQPPINIPLFGGNPRRRAELQFTQLRSMWKKLSILSLSFFTPLHLSFPPYTFPISPPFGFVSLLSFIFFHTSFFIFMDRSLQ